MNNSLASVLPLNRPDQVILHYPRLVANTGERPILVVTTDNREFWCKKYDYDSKGVTVVNEIVATEIGRIIGAPVRDWAVVNVPAEFHGRRVLDSDQTYSRLPMFGSLHIPRNTTKDYLMWADKDGNFSRIPKLIALWHLCNADDAQVIYDLEADSQIYSLDHGYWFGSFEGVRDLVEGMTLYEPLPLVRGRIPAEYWDEAVDCVSRLNKSSSGRILSMLPREWDITEAEIMEMVEYAISRIDYTIEILESYKQKYCS